MNLIVLSANNLRRNKLRTALTVVGTAVTILAFVFLRTVVWAYDVQINDTASDRIWTWNKVNIFIPMPRRYADEVRAMKEVRVASFAKALRFVAPQHDDDPFLGFGVDEGTYFEVFDDMLTTPEALKAFKEDREATIVGRPLMEKFGWKEGQTITLAASTPDFATSWQFRIVGVYDVQRKSIWPDNIMFHWDLLNERVLRPSLKDRIGWIVARTARGTAGPDACAAIDKAFDTADVQTLSQDDRSWSESYMGSVSTILKAINVVTFVVLGIMMLVLGNTVAMGVRERRSEYGILLAIGFRPYHVLVLVLGEAALIGGLGGAIGVGLAYPAIDLVMGPFIVQNYPVFFPFFALQTETAATAVGIGVAAGLLASVVPALRVCRMRVIDALRSVA